MDAQTRDILMYFQHTGGRFVSGQSTDTLPKGDPLTTKGFTAGSFFAIDEFGFGAGLVDPHADQGEGEGDDEGDDAESPKARAAEDAIRKKLGFPPRPRPRGRARAKARAKAKARSRKPGSDFAAWRDAGGGTDDGYPLDLHEITFSRRLDSSSVQLFEACSKSVMFASAALVKRRSVGDKGGLHTFLRIDFTDVLITDVRWDDDEVLRESYSFVCRALKFEYLPQDGGGRVRPDKSGGGLWDPLSLGKQQP